MKRSLIFYGAVLLISMLPSLALAATTVSGTVYRSGGGFITLGDVDLIDPANNFATIMVVDIDPATGSYEFTGVEDGSYLVNPLPDIGSIDQYYVPTSLPIDVSDGVPVTELDFILELGGNISGTVILDRATSTPERIAVNVYTPEGQWEDWAVITPESVGTVQELTYSSHAVLPGYYTVEFSDHMDPQEFVMQWYNGRAHEDTPYDEVEVSAGTTTEHISAVLSSTTTISGTVNKADGGVVTSGWVDLLTDTFGATGISVPIQPDGTYTINNILPDEYHVEALPDPNSADQYYVQLVLPGPSNPPITVAARDSITQDFTLELGGRVSGTITLPEAPVNPNDIAAHLMLTDDLYNFTQYNLSQAATGTITYITNAYPPGSYNMIFMDYGNQYLSEWYDDQPIWFNPFTTTITVTAETITEDIDADLLRFGDADGRYFVSWPGIGTSHKDTYEGTTTSASVGLELARLSDGSPIAQNAVSSITLTPPAPLTPCTDYIFNPRLEWMLQGSDGNADGAITPNEIDSPRAIIWSGYACEFGTTPHPAGDYQLDITFENLSTFSNTYSLAAGIDVASLPPVTNLAASWDTSTNQLTLTWNQPSPAYSANFMYDLRVIPYNNGVKMNQMVRARNMPAGGTGEYQFVFQPDLTAPFNNSQVDQIMVWVKVKASNVPTSTTTKRNFNFDHSVTEPLQISPITQQLLDIDGDGQTGLPEAIHSLRSTVGQ